MNINICSIFYLLAKQGSDNSISAWIIVAVIFFWIGIFINYLITKEFYSISKQKGYNQEKYFWICFFLGIIGYLLVIALPNLRNNSSNVILESSTENDDKE